MRVLWITSFDRAMYEASGQRLMDTFHAKQVEGQLLVCYEGMEDPKDAHSNNAFTDWLLYHKLDDDAFLQNWLSKNRDVIPKHLGGTHPGCQCRKGPFSPHDKRHKMPCVGHWFNRNASRWFRKVACLKHALDWNDTLTVPWDVFVWVDADCYFKQQVNASVVENWFEGPRDKDPRRNRAAVFYHRAQRPVMEAGVMGYWLERGADKFLRLVIRCYDGGSYRKLKRWDDSFVLQHNLGVPEMAGLKRVDLASHVGEHSAVIPYGPVGQYIVHDKGLHGRKLGIMT